MGERSEFEDADRDARRRDGGSIAPELLLAGRNRVLDRLVSGAPFDEVLATVAEVVQELKPGVLCSVLLLDETGQRLRVAAAPGLPQVYNQAIDGVTIGPKVGSCGAAAALGERVVAEDVLEHPNWVDYRDLAQRARLRSCWSEPIRASTGEVTGTIAMYRREPGPPDGADLELLSVASRLAAVAIDRHRSRQAARTSQTRLLQVINALPHMIFAKDRTGRFLLANRAVADAYGTTVEQLMGQDHGRLHGESAEVSDMLADDLEVIESGQQKFIAEEPFTDCHGNRRILQTTKVPFAAAETGEPAVLGIAVDITARKAAEEQIMFSREQLRVLASELVRTEERERRRLASDMHDGLLQTLLAVRMKLAELAGEEGAGELGALAKLMDEALESARSLTFDLSPPVLHDHGLTAALQMLVEDMAQRFGLEVLLEAGDPEEPLDERVKLTLFRCVRELLINVAKHAEARVATVTLRRSEQDISVTVRDDGRGFDAAHAVSARGGFGLVSIRERLGVLGGAMDIRSEPGAGTAVTISLTPRPAAANGS